MKIGPPIQDMSKGQKRRYFGGFVILCLALLLFDVAVYRWTDLQALAVIWAVATVLALILLLIAYLRWARSSE